MIDHELQTVCATLTSVLEASSCWQKVSEEKKKSFVKDLWYLTYWIWRSWSVSVSALSFKTPPLISVLISTSASPWKCFLIWLEFGLMSTTKQPQTGTYSWGSHPSSCWELCRFYSTKRSLESAELKNKTNQKTFLVVKMMNWNKVLLLLLYYESQWQQIEPMEWRDSVWSSVFNERREMSERNIVIL